METKKIKEYLFNYYKNKYPDFLNSIEDLDDINKYREIFSEFEEIISRDSRRWWDVLTVVGKIGDKYFKWEWASANRDQSIFDLGWGFDWYSIQEVEPKEETITVINWVPKK